MNQIPQIKNAPKFIPIQIGKTTLHGTRIVTIRNYGSNKDGSKYIDIEYDNKTSSRVYPGSLEPLERYRKPLKEIKYTVAENRVIKTFVKDLKNNLRVSIDERTFLIRAGNKRSGGNRLIIYSFDDGKFKSIWYWKADNINKLSNRSVFEAF